jgi:tetratricopeptide (TPR) repeat protein
MAAGYLWAIVPAVLILVGVGVAGVRFLRKPSARIVPLARLSGRSRAELEFYDSESSLVRASQSVLRIICSDVAFFGAVGWETTNSWTRFRFLIDTLVIVWALNSLATFFIIPSVPQHLYAVKILGQQGKIEQAATESAKAVEADPSNAAAHGYRALSLSELGDDAEAVKEAEHAVELAPTDSAAHLNLAIAAKRTDVERAMAEARRAIELGPENFLASQLLMKFLLESGRYNEAAAFGPEWLAVSPFDVAAHSSMAAATAQTGDLATAARHLGYVMMLRPNAEEALGQVHQILLSLAKAPDGLQRLRDIAANAPDSPRMLDELAWLLAKYPDSNARDGAESVRLAARACDLTDRRVPALLATLAAAYAEAGDFLRAVAAGEEALSVAHSLGDTDGIKLSENILASVRANVPYRHEPEQ